MTLRVLSGRPTEQGYGRAARHASHGLAPQTNSSVALMARLSSVGLSWPSESKSPSRRGYWVL